MSHRYVVMPCTLYNLYVTVCVGNQSSPEMTYHYWWWLMRLGNADIACTRLIKVDIIPLIYQNIIEIVNTMWHQHKNNVRLSSFFTNQTTTATLKLFLLLDVTSVICTFYNDCASDTLQYTDAVHIVTAGSLGEAFVLVSYSFADFAPIDECYRPS